mgnify:FL=1
MSYIITSNIDVNQQNKTPTVQTQGLNRAFTYSNSMDNIVIPENSEISVASVKVNREGQFTVSQDNNRFALYHGPEVDAPTSTLGYMEELSQPILGTIRGANGGATSTFNTDDYARAVQESMRLFTFHPNYMKSSLNPSGTEVSASRVANVGFKGFNFSQTSYSGSVVVDSASLLASTAGYAPARNTFSGNNPPEPAPRADVPAPYVLTPSGTSCIITNEGALADEGLITAPWSTILPERPLSLVGAGGGAEGGYGGDITFDIQDYRRGAGTDPSGELYGFAVGLTRAQTNYKVYDDATTERVNFAPYIFDLSTDTEDVGYYDWVVRAVPTQKPEGAGGALKWVSELRIFHAVNDYVKAGVFSGAHTRLVEVDYVSTLANNARYRPMDSDFGHDEEEIHKIQFIVNGESITINFINSNGDGEAVSSKAYSGSAYKSERLKPVNSMCWNLYPKVHVKGYGTGAAAATYSRITIDKYEGVKPDGHQYGGATKTQAQYLPVEDSGIYDSMTDFYSYTKNQSGKVLQQITLQDCVTEAINYFGANAIATVPPQRISISFGSAFKKCLNISDVLIMGESLNYTTEIGRPNTNQILGFPNNAVIVGKYGVIGVSAEQRTVEGNLLTSAYGSDSIPLLVSGESSFIRLRNLTTQSYNVANRSFSKILYHIPKFDNAGNELGALFFEPGERVYVKLNNSTAINVNTFDVDLVDAREVVSPVYAGTTVVCFHIRKSNQ